METVLVVEDDHVIRRATVRILKASGYMTLSARDGGEALRVAREFSGAINLLLSDVIMPGEDGRTAAKRIVEKYPSARVLFMSGYTDSIILRQGVELDEINFIHKPFTSSALLKKVRAVLDEDVV